MRDIAILGASGFARQVAWCARQSGDYVVVAMIDETSPKQAAWQEISILPSLNDLGDRYSELALLSAVGCPDLRRRWAQKYERQTFVTVIDQSAVIAERNMLGVGCVVLAGTIVSTEVHVGDHSLLGFNVTLSHETRVGSFSHLANGVILNGNARVGNGCRIGAGAIILPGIEVGDNAVVGAGALVTKNVNPGATVAGVPARRVGPKRP